MLTVPEPLPNDPEAVITALETAEIFGKQGDLKEAVRWVRRAAEIAGDEGSDERALTLARAVADLNISASQPPQPPPPLPGASAPAEAAPPPPPPPPPPLTAGSTAYDVPPADADEDAETRVVDSAKMLEELDKQHSAPQPTNGSNGTAAASAAAAAAASAVAAIPSPAPEPAAEAPPPPPAEEASPSQLAEEAAPGSRRVSSMAELLAQKEAEATSAALAAAEADEAWHDAPDPVPSTPPEPMERRTARPDGARIATPLIPSKPYTERPPVEAPVLQAVRASIVATAEPGVFVLRVLTAGQSVAPTAHEVLVVATDPSASPFGQK